MRPEPKFKIGHTVSIPYFTGQEYCGPVMSVTGILDCGDHYQYRCMWMNCGDPRQAFYCESEIKLVDKQVNVPLPQMDNELNEIGANPCGEVKDGRYSGESPDQSVDDQVKAQRRYVRD
jgi:hypothetical protein